MKIIVAIKRVVDYQVKIRVKANGDGIEADNVKMSINPFDEIAIEEAIRCKEQGIASEVLVVSIGTSACEESLRQALALGADRALLIKYEADLESLQVARLLQAVVMQEKPQVVLLGKQAIDNDCNQTGQMLAGLLDWPQATFVSQVKFMGDKIEVVREVDGGLETLSLSLPAVITTDLRLNKPRFASLPNIMKSKSKPLIVKNPEQLGVEIVSDLEVLHVKPPVKRESGVKVNNIKELMGILKNREELLP